MKVFLILIIFCLSCNEKISKNKFCDPSSESFKFELLFRLSRQDNSAFCFFSGRNLVSGNQTGTPNRTPDNSVATPVFSPPAGHYNTPQIITLSTSTVGALIYFTIDGSTPSASSTLYTTGLGHIWSAAGKNIQAIAIKQGMTNSSISSEDIHTHR
jgi:hypothetical protein